MKELKLFVWENVLTGYTEGLVCILAHDIKEAIQLLKEKDSLAYETMSNKGNLSFYKNKLINYKIITKPEAFLMWGGG